MMIGNPKNKQVIVIGIDGLPYSFFRKLDELGTVPFISSLFKEQKISPMATTLPPVSSVAWASFLTGMNPGVHGITGFVDRETRGYNPFVPTASNLRVPTIYQFLSRHGFRVCSLGVPATYPPSPINGILVSGFLAPNLENGVYPREELGLLKSFDYQLDIDAWSARKSIESLYEQLPESLNSRLSAAMAYLNREKWDLFVLHILETDRLHHFLWKELMDGEKDAVELFGSLYRTIDNFISEIFNSADEKTSIILLSDHGFMELKKDVYLNRWLMDNGYLSLNDPNSANLNGMNPGSKAFSMAPGRIYIHTQNKTPNGRVREGIEADSLRNEISRSLMTLRDGETGERVIGRVVDMREEWKNVSFEGSALQLPDLIAEPKPGYELKGDLNAPGLFGDDRFSGMHSYGDAFVYLDGSKAKAGIDITEISSIICGYLDAPQFPGKSNLY